MIGKDRTLITPNADTSDDIGGVPEVSIEWSRSAVDAAEGTAEWLQITVEVFTDAGLLILAALMLLAVWRLRDHNGRYLALALLAPVSTALAYGVSRSIKNLVEQARPCQVIPTMETIAACPPLGNWSFPSNHAALAGAAAVGILLAERRLGLIALATAALIAASRVFVGAHFPHDVVVGFGIGVIVAAAVAALAHRPLASIIQQQRERHRVP